MKKLLLIGHTYMIAVNREKAKSLSRYFEVCVCTSDPDGWIALGKEVEDQDDPGHSGCYTLERLKRWPHTQKFTLLALKGLGRVMKAFQPDVILVENEPWSLLRWQSWFLSWLFARDAIFAEFTWENVTRPGIKGKLLGLIYKAAAATSDRVVCGNQAAASFFKKAGMPEANILVDGQLGVLESDFPSASLEEKENWRVALGWSPSALVVGFCGRLVEEKGLKELASAVQKLRPVFPDLKLALLGDGPQKEPLLELDSDGQWLRVLSPVPHRLVYSFLNKLDLFVLPSRPLNQGGQVWQEQFGHVLIEAIISGAFTLGSDSGAISEVLQDPDVIFPHSDENALAAMLRHYLSSPELRLEKKTRQHQSCLDYWNHDALAGRYAEFLRGLKTII